MNKLKTSANGGHPFELDDFRWEQSAVREAFYGIATAFGVAADSFILSGCEIVGSAVAAGYLYLDGEVCKVDAHTKPALPFGHTYYWGIETTYDSSGDETFENSSSQQTYEIRRAKIFTTATPSGTMPITAKKLTELIADLTGNPQAEWDDEDIAAGMSTSGGGIASVGIAVLNFKKVGRTIHCQFRVTLTLTGSPSLVIADLSSVFTNNVDFPMLQAASQNDAALAHVHSYMNPNSGSLVFQKLGGFSAGVTSLAVNFTVEMKP